MIPRIVRKGFYVTVGGVRMKASNVPTAKGLVRFMEARPIRPGETPEAYCRRCVRDYENAQWVANHRRRVRQFGRR